jgi:hypothetical protein
MLELLVLALSGVCFGAGMGASKHRAPRRMAILWYVLAGAGLTLAVVTLPGNS